MSIAATLVPELDNEMRTTRSLLERVPDAASAWKPHPKSMSMGQLAIHLPALVGWIPAVVTDSGLDVTGPAAEAFRMHWQSTSATLDAFDRAVALGRAAIAGASDDSLLETWTLRAGSHVILALPRAAVLRAMVMNHIIHHRGQLSVYLRMNDIPLPEMYGPTADSVR